MVQGGGGARFPREAVFSGMLRPRVQNLDRDLATQAVVVGLVDDAHPAASEFASDNVARGQVHADGVRRILPRVVRSGPKCAWRRALTDSGVS